MKNTYIHLFLRAIKTIINSNLKTILLVQQFPNFLLCNLNILTRSILNLFVVYVYEVQSGKKDLLSKFPLPLSLSLSLADDTNPCPHRRTFWHLCPRGGRLGPRFEADYAPFVGRQEASRNGSRLSAGRVSAAAMTVLSVHLYHRRSLDIVLTSDKG